MPDDLQALEAELKRLRPRAVPPGLLARTEAELSPAVARGARGNYSTATSWRSWKWAAWPAATAAMVALAWLLSRGLRPVSQSSLVPAPGATTAVPLAADIYKPVRADNVLYGTREEGDVTLTDGSPARRVRSQYVDTI